MHNPKLLNPNFLELNHVQASGPGTEASGKAASDVPTSAAHFTGALCLNQIEAGM